MVMDAKEGIVDIEELERDQTKICGV